MMNGLPDVAVVDDNNDPGEEYISNDGRFHVATYKYDIGLQVKSSKKLIFQFPTTIAPTDPVNGGSADLSNRTVKRDLIQMVNWEQLYNRCTLYRGFIDGTLLLDHHQRWGLATNLLCLMGGETKFFEGLSKRPEYNLDKWDAECQHISKRCYAPARYSTFYPEAEEIAQAINLVEAAKLKAGQIHIYESPEYLTPRGNSSALCRRSWISRVRAFMSCALTPVFEVLVECPQTTNRVGLPCGTAAFNTLANAKATLACGYRDIIEIPLYGK